MTPTKIVSIYLPIIHASLLILDIFHTVKLIKGLKVKFTSLSHYCLIYMLPHNSQESMNLRCLETEIKQQHTL